MKTEIFANPFITITDAATGQARHTVVRATRFVSNAIANVAAITFALLLLTGPSACAQVEMGELGSRTPVQTDRAMSALMAVQSEIPQSVANIAAQGPPLSEAIAGYRADPSTTNALRLLKEEAKIASVGSAESVKIASHSDRAGEACYGLSAQCAADANSLLAGYERAQQGATQFKEANARGLDGLRRIHADLRSRGVTNEIMLTRSERTRIAEILRLTGRADLCGRFLQMDARATEDVRSHLLALAEKFKQKGNSFKTLADSYRGHADSFRVVASSVAHLSQAIALGQKYSKEFAIATSMENTLTGVDDAMTGTLDDLPSDVSVRGFLQHPLEQEKPAEVGLFRRLLRALGVGGQESNLSQK